MLDSTKMCYIQAKIEAIFPLQYYLHFKREKGSVPLRPGEKNQKIRKSLFIVWSQCVLQCINSNMKKNTNVQN